MWKATFEGPRHGPLRKNGGYRSGWGTEKLKEPLHPGAADIHETGISAKMGK